MQAIRIHYTQAIKVMCIPKALKVRRCRAPEGRRAHSWDDRTRRQCPLSLNCATVCHRLSFTLAFKIPPGKGLSFRDSFSRVLGTLKRIELHLPPDTKGSLLNQISEYSPTYLLGSCHTRMLTVTQLVFSGAHLYQKVEEEEYEG